MVWGGKYQDYSLQLDQRGLCWGSEVEAAALSQSVQSSGVCVCFVFIVLKKKTVLGDPRSVVIQLLLHVKYCIENLPCKDSYFF